jgi:hypothetical protein
MPQIQQAVEALQNAWYNAFVNGAGLDKTKFSFVQSGTQLPYDTKGLWQAMVDAIPPKCLTHVVSFGAINGFCDNYGTLTTVVLPPVNDNFKRAMGDDYNRWMDFRRTEVTIGMVAKAGGWISLFDIWADMNLPSGRIPRAKAAFRNDQRNIVVKSGDRYLRNIPDPESLPLFTYDPGNVPLLYNITIDDIIGGAIAHGPSKSIFFDSATSSSSVTDTWAGGGISGFFDIFWGGASASYHQSTEKFASSRVTVKAEFKHVLPVKTFLPGDWFSSSFLNYVYKTKDNRVWPAGDPVTWESTFGSSGNMQRHIEELVIVDGIDITVTSSASYSAAEQEDIRARASAGIWPFFRVSASGGYSSSTTFSDSGTMTTRTTCPEGNPAVFGMNVRSIESALI